MFLRDLKESGVPDLDNMDEGYFRKRYQYHIKMREDLRKRFRLDYLGQLKNYWEKSNKCSELLIGNIGLGFRLFF